ncbi:MAG: integrase family protein [Novosphingobium sp.]
MIEVIMGKAQNFSPSSIDALVSGKRSDPNTPGLCVLVGASGKKIWQFRRRIAKSGAIVKLKLGQYPAFTIPAARQWAQQLNEAIERGEDPREAMRAEKARETLNVEYAHGIYMEAMRRGDRKKLKPRTLSDKEVIFTRDIKPRLGTKPLLTLTEDECWDAVYDKAKASKVRANKMAGELSCFLRWCASREGRMAGIDLAAHPAPTLNSNWFSTGSKANQRFLSVEEIGWLFQALVDEPLTYRRGFVLLLLTAARRNELFGAPTSEIVDGVWRLPPERSKNGEENIVELGPWGRRLAQTNHIWLFPSPRIDGPQLCGWFKARDRIHRKMEELAGKAISSWHFHDLRRTFRSHARGLGIDRDIAELMLNHKRKGIEGVYNKNQELELRAEGFAKWEAFLTRIAISVQVGSYLNIPDQVDCSMHVEAGSV